MASAPELTVSSWFNHRISQLEGSDRFVVEAAAMPSGALLEPGQKGMDYGLQKKQRLQVAVDQAWGRAKALWQEAQQLRERGADAPWAPWFTRLPLERVFGWSDLEPCNPRRADN